ncbi:retrovirus-related pol polyprotein from transposon TNT 1-94 [Tanacetum coccineum]|uniref:Retrovirus-related pol polyprotein from transposon TNT 1-94 n=1 Tax=Tanacetum coccineum TaxID=301880 RepID=A0ABQ5ELJ8_9ASTR
MSNSIQFANSIIKCSYNVVMGGLQRLSPSVALGESINVQDLKTNLYWEFGESLESYYSRFTVGELAGQKSVSYYKSSSECPVLTSTTTRMEKNEVNEIRAERLARTANPLTLVAQQQPVYHHQNHPNQNTQYSSTRSQQSTKNKGKAIITSSALTYDLEPATVTEDEEMSKEKEIDKLMALISLLINKGTGYDNQGAVNVAGARENVGTLVVQKSGIQKWKHLICTLDIIQEVTPDPVDYSSTIFDDEPMNKPESDETHCLEKESRSKYSEYLIRPFDYDKLNNLYDLVYTDLDEVTNLQCDYLETLEKCEHLEKELSKSRTMSKSFEALQKHAINLELDLQQCKEKIKNDKSFKRIFSIKRVYYVEGLNHNLFSVGQFCDADLEVAFQKSTCYIRDLKGNDLLTGSHLARFVFPFLCKISTTPNPLCLRAKATSSQAMLGRKAKRRLTLDVQDKTPGVLIDFLTLVQRGLHAQVTTVRTDKCTEFLNKNLHAYFAKEEIRHETSTARTPEQNGVVERRNRTLVEAARTMLSAAKVLLFFGLKQLQQVFYQNRSLVIPRHDKTPYHIINARKPSVKFFHIFVKVTGYLKENRIIVETFMLTLMNAQIGVSSVSSDTEQGETSSRHVDASNMHTIYQHHPSAQCWTKDHPLEQVIGNPSQSIRTRRHLEINGEMCMFSLTVSRTEPKNIKEVMADSAWIESMQEELHQFDRLDVWELVDRPLCKNVINLKWLWKNKRDEENTLIRNKSHLHGMTSCDSIGTPMATKHLDADLSDSDHAGCLDSRKSTSGGIQFLGGDKLVSWSSKKQDCTSMSSAEAEYVSLSACCAQVLWLRTQLIDYGFTTLINYLDDLFTKALSVVGRLKYLGHERFGIQMNLEGRMPTKIELTLEQSQQGVSNDVLVSIEGVEE